MREPKMFYNPSETDKELVIGGRIINFPAKQPKMVDGDDAYFIVTNLNNHGLKEVNTKETFRKSDATPTPTATAPVSNVDVPKDVPVTDDVGKMAWGDLKKAAGDKYKVGMSRAQVEALVRENK